jgi:hypothetical protein
VTAPGRCDRCGAACLRCEVGDARDTWEAKRAELQEARAALRREREERKQERAGRRAELDQQFLELRLAGHTLDDIGARYGLTRERVRQRLAEFAPGIADEIRGRKSEAAAQRRLERRKAAEEARRQLAQEQGIPCVTCGSLTLKSRSTDHFATCSKDCQRLFLALRNHFGWVGSRRGPGLNGERTYIRPGSVADAAAIEVHQRRLPIFGLLPEAIQKQISGESPRLASYVRKGGMRPKPESHPCAKCGQPTTNRQWCSRECWSNRGSVKAAS